MVAGGGYTGKEGRVQVGLIRTTMIPTLTMIITPTMIKTTVTQIITTTTITMITRRGQGHAVLEWNCGTSVEPMTLPNEENMGEARRQI